MCDELTISNLVKAATKTYPNNKVLQKVAVTQAVHESGLLSRSGPSKLASEHNNLFGIKGEGTAGSVKLMTWEHINGEDVRVREPFAKHKTLDDSFEHHAELMSWSRYKRVRESVDQDEAFEMLQKCGYATDPRYPKKLKNIYRKYISKHY